VRASVVGLLLAAAFVLSGCQYLFGLAAGGGPIVPGGPVVVPGGSFDPGMFGSFDPGDFGSFDPNDPGFSMPPPTTTYTNGSATVTIDGQATTLGELSGTAGVYEGLGAEVSWTDGAGLYLRFYGEVDSPFGDGFVILDKIADGKHLTTIDPSGCKVAVDKDTGTTLSGTATCAGLRWADAISPTLEPPSASSGEPAFDAEITFRAEP
jgi:hypothetical protein